MSEWRLQLWPPGGGRWPRPGRRGTRTARGQRGCGWGAFAILHLRRRPHRHSPGLRHSRATAARAPAISPTPSPHQVPFAHTQDRPPGAALPFQCWVPPSEGSGGRPASTAPPPPLSQAPAPWSSASEGLPGELAGSPQQGVIQLPPQ